MNAARRSLRRRDFPPNLYEPRPSYYVWRHPKTRQTFALGYIPLAAAKHQALQANAHVDGLKPSLLDRLTGATNTVALLLGQMPVSANSNTAKSHRSLDALILAELGSVPCMDLTVADCARVIEGIREGGKARWAQAVRSRLISVCRRGCELGWMESNLATVTANPKVLVQRGRLTLEMFNAILARAGEVAEWLPLAMKLAIVTAQDRSTIAGMKRSMVRDGCLVVHRKKTEKHHQPVAIPLVLRLDVLGLSLADLVSTRTGVVSPYLVHHVRPWGNAPTGSPVAVDRISHAFSEARDLAGIKGENPATFHEIRSLSLRLLKAQGNVDTKALASHSQDKTHALYQDPRGVAPVRVRIG